MLDMRCLLKATTITATSIISCNVPVTHRRPQLILRSAWLLVPLLPTQVSC